MDHEKLQITNLERARAASGAGQAATELAVFGAILIFILGAIIRSAVGNSYEQNQNFKAMRMAMLSSWNGSKATTTSRNSASVEFVEDRLSPDINKYGDLDRNPFIASGSGSFSYMMFYPVVNPPTATPSILSVGFNQPFPDTTEAAQNLPLMDVYINGAHFSFTTASFNTKTIVPTSTSSCPYTGYSNPTPQQQCVQNQCLRNAREWIGGVIRESDFEQVDIPANYLFSNYGSISSLVGKQQFAASVFNFLASPQVGIITNVTGSGLSSQGTVSSAFVPSFFLQPNSPFTLDVPFTGVFVSTFIPWFNSTFKFETTSVTTTLPNGGGTVDSVLSYVGQIALMLTLAEHPYKLFYTRVAQTQAPTTNVSPCGAWNVFGPSANINALCAQASMPDINGNMYTNTDGAMAYDLLRTGNYAAVDQQFPPFTLQTPVTMRSFIAWHWAAAPAISDSALGLNPTDNQYPTFDIDGRLKEVTIYGLSYNSSTGSPTVLYEDNQGGDIDTTWDADSCGPKPGLQGNADIFTITNSGTYLQIEDGKMYNPETGQFVRSVNKDDTIDVIQRTIQLSNNTGRFCSMSTPNVLCGSPGDTDAGVSCSSPNPVEVCVNSSSTGASTSCFSSNTIAQTCFDAGTNMIYVRSRLQNSNGHFWMTNASGQLQVK